MNHPTFTAWRNAVQSAEGTVIHASLPFFALAENRPTPSQPDWVEIACFKRNNNGEGILAYLSLVDAELDRQNFNRAGRGYRIVPFEAIDPRHFIQTHERWLSVYAVYGFAARGEQLLTDASGQLKALSHIKHFHIAPEAEAHFHLNFGEQAFVWLEALHRAAGIPDYASMIEDLAGSSAAEIERLAACRDSHWRRRSSHALRLVRYGGRPMALCGNRGFAVTTAFRPTIRAAPYSRLI